MSLEDAVEAGSGPVRDSLAEGARPLAWIRARLASAVRTGSSRGSNGGPVRPGRTATRDDPDPSTASERDAVDPDELSEDVADAGERAAALSAVLDQRTLDVDPSLEASDFFGTDEGGTAIATRYDMERAVPTWEKTHFEEVQRYWVNHPYAFVTIMHARRENETKYVLVEPHLSEEETALYEFLAEKLRASLEYGLGSSPEEDEDDRAAVIERAARRLLERYGLLVEDESPWATVRSLVGSTTGEDDPDAASTDAIPGTSARPGSIRMVENDGRITEYQVRKLLYYLRRDFVGYERIDAIKRDVNVEDVSCDGYDSPVFVYHTDHGNLITNVSHGRDELDDFVIKLAQRSGKAISKRRPQVDATLPDDSRAQLTLGREVSDHGTNYTIRQFRDVPFTPVDLINWRTFSIDQMAYLWLAIENGKSMLFAGGTASGKTTSLNALSLFVPSTSKVVSIEDTREVELPHRNWVASVTRSTLSTTGRGEIDEFDLLEAAFRQRPDYIVMGEVRGEEGRTLFQIMSTGHTTYTTFHAGSVDEVVKRFTNDPIDVSKTLFTSLDLIAVQAQTRIGEESVRRNRTITEVDGYDPDADEVLTEDVYRWRADGDAFDQVGSSTVLEEVAADRGWDEETLEAELRKRRVVIAYLVENGLTSYAQVAATIQAFISDQDLTLSLIADDSLASSLSDLRRVENVDVDIDDETEALVPRPEPDEEALERANAILDDAEALLAARRSTGVVDGSVLPASSHLVEGGEAAPEPDRRSSEDQSGER